MNNLLLMYISQAFKYTPQYLYLLLLLLEPSVDELSQIYAIAKLHRYV